MHMQSDYSDMQSVVIIIHLNSLYDFGQATSLLGLNLNFCKMGKCKNREPLGGLTSVCKAL